MNNNNANKETESLENCSKFVQKFKDILKTNHPYFRNSSVENNNHLNWRKNFFITNKHKSKLPNIINSRNINYSNDKNEKSSFNTKFKLSPQKYLLNLESLSHKEDTIFQFDKIRGYLKYFNNNKGKEENSSKQKINFIEEKTNKNNIKNKKLGLTINEINDSNNYNKLFIDRKEREKIDNSQSSKLDSNRESNKKIIQNFIINKRKNISSKKIFIRNFINEKENKPNINMKNSNTLLKSASEIFKNELLKRELFIKKDENEKLNSSKSEKLILNLTNNYKVNNTNRKKTSLLTLNQIKQTNTINNNKYHYLIYPGNNGKLIKSCIKNRSNWEELPSDKKKSDCNLLWTPLSIQINFHFHKVIENSQIINHFENNKELTNKRNIFINLLHYCENNIIDLFSFYPLTIIIPLSNDNFYITYRNFKNIYYDLPNLVEDKDKKNVNFLNKFYWDYFHVKPNTKIGNVQRIVIPKTHYSGKNLWLIKRVNLNRGRQIKVMSNLVEITQEINQIKKEENIKYIIIQKYIERPLLYCRRKFDIRIWVLFSYLGNFGKFEAYVFKEGHLKASSEIFNLNSLDLFIHLTNYSIQKNNKNFSKIEIGNEISFNDFQNELNKNKEKNINFKTDIFNKIVKIIGITANIAKYKINAYNTKNCFEIFGYDFMLDEEYNPYLLEINTNPGYEESSPLITMLVPRMIDDALRLTIDKIFERNDKDKNSSKFKVDGYTNEENMWQKIRV